jgi:AraC family transcriptional regulator
VEGPVGARSTYADGDVSVTSARLNGFTVNHFVFPPFYSMRLDPEHGYVGVVLEGGMVKTFPDGVYRLRAGSAFTMPAGAFHDTEFGSRATRVIVLHPVEGVPSTVPWTALLGTFREVPASGTAWRLAGELLAADDAWLLAAEGLCLDVVAGLLRAGRVGNGANGSRAWLEAVREQLHASVGDRPMLDELATSVGVHPARLSRAFREHYGLTIGEYWRRRRLDRITAELTATETPIAALAAEAGFADQSHFTRAFRRHTGLTPARYRRAVRG